MGEGRTTSPRGLRELGASRPGGAGVAGLSVPAIRVVCAGHLPGVLMCVASLDTNIEHLFGSLFAFHVSSLMNVVFKCFDQFLKHWVACRIIQL